MGETLDTIDKLSFKYQNKCPIHNEPYSGVCIEKGCYETGVICSKCTPKSCIDTLGHKKLSVDDFFQSYLKIVVREIDFKALNNLITLGSQVQTKQLELEEQVFEEWELKFINEKFEKFREKISNKFKDFLEKLLNKIQNIYQDFLKSKKNLENTSVVIPDIKLESTIKYLEENKENKEKYEQFFQTLKMYMDDEKLVQYMTDLENMIYGKILMEHLKHSQNEISELDNIKNNINNFCQNFIKSIFPDKDITNPFLNTEGASYFKSNPEKLKFKETITNNCLKSYTIDNIFDAFSAFDGNVYVAHTVYSNNNVEVINLKDNSLKATLKGATDVIYMVKHFPDYTTCTDYLLSTTTSKSFIIWNLKDSSIHLNIKTNHVGKYMYSSSIFFDDINNKTYVLTSSPSDYMKLYDFYTGKYIRDVGSNVDFTYYVNSFKHKDKYYLINGNSSNVKVYGMDYTNDVIGTFSGPSKTWHMSAFVKFHNGIETLFESDGYGDVRLWNYEKQSIICTINCPSCNIRGIILWNSNYIIASSHDKTVRIIDIEKKKWVLNLTGHTDALCAVRKVVHPKYGECLLSGSVDGSIKLWTINNDNNY